MNLHNNLNKFLKHTMYEIEVSDWWKLCKRMKQTNKHAYFQRYTTIGDNRNKMLYSKQFSSVIPQENTRYTITKGDSAASSHYFASRDKGILSNVRQNNPPTTTILPNQSCIQAHQQGNVSIPSLSNKATNTIFFENLNHCLISIGQFCDDGCTVVLSKLLWQK